MKYRVAPTGNKMLWYSVKPVWKMNGLQVKEIEFLMSTKRFRERISKYKNYKNIPHTKKTI